MIKAEIVLDNLISYNSGINIKFILINYWNLNNLSLNGNRTATTILTDLQEGMDSLKKKKGNYYTAIDRFFIKQEKAEKIVNDLSISRVKLFRLHRDGCEYISNLLKEDFNEQ